jgi:predicted nucleic acid-binding protein
MVIDANVWVAAFLPGDVHHAVAASCISRIAATKTGVILPTLALVETCGAIARRTDTPEAAIAIMNFLKAQNWIEFAALDSALMQAATDIAMTCRLRGADAVYVALALIHKKTLLTLDGEMLKRAQDLVKCTTPQDWQENTANQ